MSPVSATSLSATRATLRAGHATALADSRPVEIQRRPVADYAPSQLGTWLLESKLAEGARSQVFCARPAEASDANRRLTRYAVKVLRPQWNDDPMAVAQMRREAHAGRCVASAHVVPILSAHVHRPPFYIVMPLLPGKTVAALIAAQCRLQIPRALWIARQAAEALALLHITGYIHGDLKPANLMVSPEGHVTLIDLGCARQIEHEPTLESPSITGTPHYLAPEVFAGWPADSRSDIYGLGITLFEMVTGRLPIESNDLATISAFKRDGAMPSLRLFAPEAPSSVADFVRQLTAREPLRRPQSAAEVVQALVRLEISSLDEQIPA